MVKNLMPSINVTNPIHGAAHVEPGSAVQPMRNWLPQNKNEPNIIGGKRISGPPCFLLPTTRHHTKSVLCPDEESLGPRLVFAIFYTVQHCCVSANFALCSIAFLTIFWQLQMCILLSALPLLLEYRNWP